ncbi:DUF4902 domain-containing protein [Glaciimonas immobilis]|uniref:DUF4902 domain-containing protein n=1 Tax=Glaciimonas immobilis TaxID=728004 RepID=A0A840RYP6_9BURK|nr:DUF4902 domain-containing protein [Glaciimonas immobilis]KAF3996241.1 DUF4902 domain-containing protein [Glaciimonas immobilis]MBB5202352.1 hypothetical protein [Glaciimonas immobilis]
MNLSNVSTENIKQLFQMIRLFSASSQWDLSPAGKIFTISSDGYIRLLFEELQNITLVHLISGLDQDMPSPILGGAVTTTITGYTEWVTATSPGITLGWDWQLAVVFKSIHLHRISEPRSNVMMHNSDRVDMGPIKTTTLLENFIDNFDWQSTVQKHITGDYGQ